MARKGARKGRSNRGRGTGSGTRDRGTARDRGASGTRGRQSRVAPKVVPRMSQVVSQHTEQERQVGETIRARLNERQDLIAGGEPVNLEEVLTALKEL
ncbi:hypothetical protein KIPB_010761, partial [Kipferlia bialata]|eukprot:g10761.t1